jgi:hypothetical protein
MIKEEWDEFENKSNDFLSALVPELEKQTAAIISYSFLSYLAALCVADEVHGVFKRHIKSHEDCLDFFHNQLDVLYNSIKRGNNGQTD